MRIIDVHGHISPASVDKALAAMDAHFIDRMVNLTAGSTIEQFTAAKQAFDEKGQGRLHPVHQRRLRQPAHRRSRSSGAR